MAESEVECFCGVKKAQNSKTEGGIGAILPRNAPSNIFRDGFFAVEPKQNGKKTQLSQR